MVSKIWAGFGPVGIYEKMGADYEQLFGATFWGNFFYVFMGMFFLKNVLASSPKSYIKWSFFLKKILKKSILNFE